MARKSNPAPVAPTYGPVGQPTQAASSGSTATTVANQASFPGLGLTGTMGQAVGALQSASQLRRTLYADQAYDARGKRTPWLDPSLNAPAWLLLDPILAQQITTAGASGQVDPYFGDISNSGGQKVYMGYSADVGAKETAAADAAGDVREPDLSDMTTYKGDLTEKRAVEGQYSNVGDNVQSLASVLNAPYTWSDAKRQQAMQTFRENGYTFADGTGNHTVRTLDDLVKAWQDMAMQAANVYDSTAGQQKVTPWDMLSRYKNDQQLAGTFVNYQNGTSKTVTKNDVQHISDGQAWNALNTALEKELGRDPTQQEVRDFAYRMNNLAAANPGQVTTTTTAHNGVTSETRTIDPGFSGVSTSPFVVDQELAQQAILQAKQDPNYGAYQAASTYFNAAVGALNAVGNGGNA